jgi:N6-adenosine-specific RNA methylase IME4
MLARSPDIIESGPFAGIARNSAGVVAADPPWKFKSRTALQSTNWHSRRDADKHYDSMTIADLCLLPVADVAAKDCHLFMWTTGPCLRQAFDVMDAWGFRYSTVAFTWAKLLQSHNPMQLRMVPTIGADFHTGLGLTTRKNAEFVLLGRRGSPRRLRKDIRELIVAPRRQHSRKPDEFFERVQQYAAGPYVELFSREQRPGWTCWGNEVGKFTGAA